jgi:pilus assembly protein CpaE
LPEIQRWEFQLLAGSPDPERANDLKVGRIPEIISALQRSFDFIVVDLGRSLSRISLPIIQRADLSVLIMSTDQSTITLTKKVLDYLHAQGIESRNIYTILNRAVGLEGLTKAEAERIIDLPIKTAVPYMGSNFVLANNLNQPIILKYPEDTTSIVFKDVGSDMIKTSTNLRNR